MYKSGDRRSLRLASERPRTIGNTPEILSDVVDVSACGVCIKKSQCYRKRKSKQ